jgi:hypothetical protein
MPADTSDCARTAPLIASAMPRRPIVLVTNCRIHSASA